MERTKVSKLAGRTPLGRLMRTLERRSQRLPIVQLMDGPMVRIPSHISVGGARQIARLKRTGHLLVSEGLRLIGLLCTDDLTGAPDTDPVWKWMRRTLLLGSMGDVPPDMEARDALAVMERHRTSFLVVNAGALVLGVVTEGRLRHALSAVPPPPANAAALEDPLPDDDSDDAAPFAAVG